MSRPRTRRRAARTPMTLGRLALFGAVSIIAACGSSDRASVPEGECPQRWNTREAASFEAMDAAARRGADALRADGSVVPGVVGVEVQAGNLFVTLEPSDWPKDATSQCALAARIMDRTLGPENRVAFPQEVRVTGRRVAVSVHETSGDYVQLME